MTIIVISIVAAIGALVAAMIFMPGVTSAVFQGLGKAFFQVLSENRDKRIERRQKYGIFGLRKRREERANQTPEVTPEVTPTPEEVADMQAADAAIEADADYQPEPRETIRHRLKDRRQRRRGRD